MSDSCEPVSRQRVFIGLVEVAGYYSSLTEGLRELGVPTSFVCLREHPFGYGKDVRTETWLTRATRWSNRKMTHAVFWPARFFWANVSRICRATLLAWAITKHDVFVFGTGSSFYKLKEFPLLKLLGKKIICVFTGSDARPPYINGALLVAAPGLVDSPKRLRNKTVEVKEKIRQIERYTDAVVSAPPQALFQTKPFVLFQALGLPVRMPAEPKRSVATRAIAGVRILHSPSSPESKGTPLIRAAMESLIHKGHKIDYVEVVGQSNSVVMKELMSCDFVVDDLYSDSPVGMFASEAAFFGKPAVLAGYCQEFVERELPPELIPPTLYCIPENIENGIERLIVDVGLRREMGRQAKEFVERKWTPTEFARRFLLVIDGKVPPEWVYDPKRLNYVPISGMHESKARNIIAGLLDSYGTAALQLADKPMLEKRFVEFARTGHRGNVA